MANAVAHAEVAVLGASHKPERFSFKAVRMLREHGYRPIRVHPSGHEVDGIASKKSLDELGGTVDTLTIYVNAKISDAEREKILRLKPRRVIFNPGAENSGLAEELREAGVEVVEDCTLVMLRANEF